MMVLLWSFAGLFAGMLALFAALTVAVTLLTRRIGEARLRGWLGGNALTAPLKGVVAGALTPFCSWSTVPVLLSLLRARVRTSTVAAFYLASPVLDPVLLVVLALLFGVPAAVGYGLTVAAATVAAAVVAERAHVERFLRDPALTAPGRIPATSMSPPSCDDGWPAEAAWEGWRTEVSGALAVAGPQLRRLVVPLGAASLIGVLIASQAPRELTITLAGDGQPLAVPAAAALGIPVYLPTEALAPLGWALRDAGVGTGAILALVITAAGLSIPEFSLLAGIVRMRVIVGLVVVVAAVAIATGLLVPALLSA